MLGRGIGADESSHDGSRKRGRQEAIREPYGRGGGADAFDDEGDEHGPPQKMKRDGHTDPNLSCPFRKRNPHRFSVLNYSACATQYFRDMRTLK